eukprot:3415609-Amphidinium_carterae.2
MGVIDTYNRTGHIKAECWSRKHKYGTPLSDHKGTTAKGEKKGKGKGKGKGKKDMHELGEPQPDATTPGVESGGTGTLGALLCPHTVQAGSR